MPANRIKVLWTGLTGLPGLSQFYVGTGITDPTPIRTFFDAIKAQFPTGLTWTVQNAGDTISETDGQIVSGWTGPAQTPVVATGGAGAYPAPSGCYVKWSGTAVVGGRRPFGKTFMVPLGPGGYSSSGAIATATSTALTVAATALIAALGGELKIWHRTGPTTAGAFLTTTAASVPNKAVVLTGRRD